ncbi:MAG: transcriptional repressor NrdR, partial [Clostridia bacterium]|nr:transcriptional repressor NrdR [Clostridia bacterium]
MKCPSCGSEDIKVVDSRPVEDNNSIRRRRECLECHNRFTTYEVIDAFQPVVLKKDGSKELFDKNKLLSGLLKACQKRPVNADDIASEIEAELQNSLRTEITTG